MKLDIVKRANGSTAKLVIDEARMLWPNFSGSGGYAPQFNIVIPNQEIADALMEDVNEYGVPWRVKISAPREEGNDPTIYLPIKVGNYAEIYVQTGNRINKIDLDDIGQIDNMDIEYIEVDVKPSDRVKNGSPYRSAYLDSMTIYQRSNRHAERYHASRMAEEKPFE